MRRFFPQYFLTSAQFDAPDFSSEAVLSVYGDLVLTFGLLHQLLQTSDFCEALRYAELHFENSLASANQFEQFLIDLHKKLAQNVLLPEVACIAGMIAQAGEYRRTPMVIDEVQPCTPIHEIAAAMRKFTAIAWERLQSLTPDLNNNVPEVISLGAWMAVEIARIHPFSNGNGRLGRILINCLLLHFTQKCAFTPSDSELYYEAIQRGLNLHDLSALENMIAEFEPLPELHSSKRIDTSNLALAVPNSGIFVILPTKDILWLASGSREDQILTIAQSFIRDLCGRRDIQSQPTVHYYLHQVLKTRWDKNTGITKTVAELKIKIDTSYDLAIQQYNKGEIEECILTCSDRVADLQLYAASTSNAYRIHQFSFIAAKCFNRRMDLADEPATKQLFLQKAQAYCQLAIEHVPTSAKTTVAAYQEFQAELEQKQLAIESLLNGTASSAHGADAEESMATRRP